MEQLNKKIKNLYDKEQMPLPPKFSWENMKDGIYEKMEDEDKPNPIFVFFTGWEKWGLTLVALLVVFAPLFFYFKLNNSSIKQTNVNISKLKENTLKQNINQFISEEKAQKPTPVNVNDIIKKPKDFKNDNNTKPINTSNKINNSLIDNTKYAKPSQHKIQNKFSAKLISPTKPTTIKLNNENVKIASTFIINEEKANVALEIPKNNITTKNAETKDILPKNIVTVNELNSFKVIKALNKKRPSLESLNVDVVIKEASNIPIIEKPEKQKEGYSLLQLDAGFTYLFSQYKKSDSLPFNGETGFPSNYINVSYRKTFSNGIYISAGLNYSKYKTKFELNDTILQTYLVENALTRSTKNIVTGKSIEVYEDIEVQALSFRNVRHYNHFEALSIPLIVGKQFNYKRLFYNIGLGSAVTIYNNAGGKTLRNNEVIDYNKSTAIPYHNKTQFATLMEFGIGLPLNNHIEITANFRHKNNITNWANDELTIKPQAISLGAGLRFKF